MEQLEKRGDYVEEVDEYVHVFTYYYYRWQLVCTQREKSSQVPQRD